MLVRNLHIITSFHWRKKRSRAIVVLRGKLLSLVTGDIFFSVRCIYEDNMF